MSSKPLKYEDSVFTSPTNIEQAQSVFSSGYIDEADNDTSPESISALARKESHRASERVVKPVFYLYIEKKRAFKY